MSTNAPQPSPAAPAAAHRSAAASEMIIVYQHSNLFYWWPVWAFGFLFALVTYFGNYHMAIVPAGTKAVEQHKITDKDGNTVERDALILAENKKVLKHKNDTDQDVVTQPTIYVTPYRSLGTVFLFVLLIVIFITNVTLRGQWSLVVLIILCAVTIIFWLAGFWEKIFDRLGNLSIFINLGGYMMISLVVFGLWLFNYFVFDRQFYAVFTPGQVRICQEIGAGEIIYDAFGMTTQKQRSDLFRHVILGFGSGDLVLRFPRVDHPIELHNILNVTSVLRRVEKMMQEKIVVAEAPAASGATISSPPAPKA